jgi:hypothetical protein
MWPRREFKIKDVIIEANLYNYQFSPIGIVVGEAPSSQGDWFADFIYEDEEYTCIYHQTLCEVSTDPPRGEELWELYETG